MLELLYSNAVAVADNDFYDSDTSWKQFCDRMALTASGEFVKNLRLFLMENPAYSTQLHAVMRFASKFVELFLIYFGSQYSLPLSTPETPTIPWIKYELPDDILSDKSRSPDDRHVLTIPNYYATNNSSFVDLDMISSMTEEQLDEIQNRLEYILIIYTQNSKIMLFGYIAIIYFSNVHTPLIIV